MVMTKCSDKDISEMNARDCHNSLHNLVVVLYDAYIEPFKKTVAKLVGEHESIDGRPTTCREVVYAAKQLFNEERMKVLEDCIDKSVRMYCHKLYHPIIEEDVIPDSNTVVIDEAFTNIFALYLDEACHNMLLKYVYDSEEYKAVCKRLVELGFVGKMLFVRNCGNRFPIAIETEVA